MNVEEEKTFLHLCGTVSVPRLSHCWMGRVSWRYSLVRSGRLMNILHPEYILRSSSYTRRRAVSNDHRASDISVPQNVVLAMDRAALQAVVTTE